MHYDALSKRKGSSSYTTLEGNSGALKVQKHNLILSFKS